MSEAVILAPLGFLKSCSSVLRASLACANVFRQWGKGWGQNFFARERVSTYLNRAQKSAMQTSDSELLLQDGILKDQIKMFMRAVNLYTFLRNCLRVEAVLCQTLGWRTSFQLRTRGS